MITREQADQAADSISEPSRKELRAKKDKRQKFAAAARRKRESPLFPAVIAAVTVYFSLQYQDIGFASVMLGAAIWGLYGWVARRS